MIRAFSRSVSRTTMSISRCDSSDSSPRRRAFEDLDRAGDRRERIADLVGEVGGELADRRRGARGGAARLHLDHLGDVLEDHDVAARIAVAARAARDRRQTEVQVLAAAVAVLEARPALLDVAARPRARSARAPGITASSARPETSAARAAGDALRLGIERGDRAGGIGGEQTARQALDGALVQPLEAREIAGALRERAPGAIALARQRAREQRHQQQRARVHAPERELHGIRDGDAVRRRLPAREQQHEAVARGAECARQRRRRGARRAAPRTR